ncbi:MAG TPA: type IIL restriction-modification enzyme MmeI, partial [Verrucomicrobiae bacterium]|nr:type IIL restriction-modification enzyme MmeI [Verrucomicrobiae bacterium]
DLVTGDGQPTRYVIDFQGRYIVHAQSYVRPFEHIKISVLPERERKAQEGKTADGELRPHHQLFLKYWWRQAYDRADMISAISKINRYVVCSAHTKRPIFNFVSKEIRPDHALIVFVFEDDYSFGVLQSSAHWLWFATKCSKLEERFRYTPDAVFDTFPWPQAPTAKQIEAVAAAGCEVRRVRDEALQNLKGGLRALYRTLELPGANPLKDAHAAYGFDANKDLLAQLLALNLEVANRIEDGDQVTAPGVPKDYRGDLVTEDCIRPPAG